MQIMDHLINDLIFLKVNMDLTLPNQFHQSTIELLFFHFYFFILIDTFQINL